jgi:hypothetical protein
MNITRVAEVVNPSPKLPVPQDAESAADDAGMDSQHGTEIELSDIAAKWMAAVAIDSTDDSTDDNEESTTDNIFAIDIGGLENVMEEDEEEEEEEEDEEKVEKPNGENNGSALTLQLDSEDFFDHRQKPLEQDEESTSPWDQYISASADQVEDLPEVEPDAHFLHT